MSQVTGVRTRLAGFTETTYGQIPGTPAGLVLPFVQNGVRAQMQREQDATIDGFRGQPRSVPGNRDINGTVQVNVAPGSIGWWLQHLIGVPTTTGAAVPYTHTFAPAASGANALPPGFTLEEDLGSAFTAASRYIRYQGCRIAQMQLTLAPSGFLTASIDVRGADYSRSATALDATLTDNGHKAFPAMSAALSVNAGAVTVKMTQFQLTYSNDLDDTNYTIGGNGVRGSMPEGFALVTGQTEFLLEDSNYLDLVLGDSDVSFDLSLQHGVGDGTAGNEKLTISIPAAVNELVTPQINGPRGVRLQANFNAFRTSGEIGVQAVLLSPLAIIDG
ncbi:MAG: phage tail tube protein [Mizugakiibacter sp.]|uniref:phage tail tube protein n=1 Tax=Mizugakiibacter sp. TaxID=1972610 RepID=UPI0032107500